MRNKSAEGVRSSVAHKVRQSGWWPTEVRRGASGDTEACGGKRRSSDNRAGSNAIKVGAGRGRYWAWSARAQVPAVTEVRVVMDASRTKRATLSRLVRMSPNTVALALLGKPNQGERLR
jgi:hypothetical protein